MAVVRDSWDQSVEQTPSTFGAVNLNSEVSSEATIVDSSELLTSQELRANNIGIHRVPPELLCHIFSFLRPYREMTAASLVCKRWYDMIAVLRTRLLREYEAAITSNTLVSECMSLNESVPLRNPAQGVFPLTMSTMSSMKSSKCAVHDRRNHAICYYGGFLYLFGGHGTGYTAFSDLFRLDLDTFEWEKIFTHGARPTPKGDAAMLAHEGKLYLYGGLNPRPLTSVGGGVPDCFSEFHIYELNEARWEKHQSLYTPELDRYRTMIIIAVGNNIVLLIVYTDHLRVYVFIPHTNDWVPHSVRIDFQHRYDGNGFTAHTCSKDELLILIPHMGESYILKFSRGRVVKTTPICLGPPGDSAQYIKNSIIVVSDCIPGINTTLILLLDDPIVGAMDFHDYFGTGIFNARRARLCYLDISKYKEGKLDWYIPSSPHLLPACQHIHRGFATPVGVVIYTPNVSAHLTYIHSSKFHGIPET